VAIWELLKKQRYEPAHRTDEDALTRDIITLASEYAGWPSQRINPARATNP
jgi:hypothetical protein